MGLEKRRILLKYQANNYDAYVIRRYISIPNRRIIIFTFENFKPKATKNWENSCTSRGKIERTLRLHPYFKLMEYLRSSIEKFAQFFHLLYKSYDGCFFLRQFQLLIWQCTRIYWKFHQMFVFFKMNDYTFGKKQQANMMVNWNV